MKSILYILSFFLMGAIEASDFGEFRMPKSANLVLQEDWSSGTIDPEKWYTLHRKWSDGNNGVVRKNVFIRKENVNGKLKNVLVCRGHGDHYHGDVVGYQGNRNRVGGVIVSKSFFASGLYEIVFKIGSKQKSENAPQNPMRPIGMVPAIWTYAYRWVDADKAKPFEFSSKQPMYNPLFKHRKYHANEYWSEIDFPEFGKWQKLGEGLYNTFLQNKHESLIFKTKSAIDGEYHSLKTIWRTELVPFEGLKDEQVAEYNGYYWVQDKEVDYNQYLGQPFKKLGTNQYAVYKGKYARHYIDDEFVGENLKWVPSMAAQLNIGVWFPHWGGKAPWSESSMQISSVKVWEFNDAGDVRGILVDDIHDTMDATGAPIKR